MSDLEVVDISKAFASHMVMKYHYSGRVLGIKYCWGLLDGLMYGGCVVYSVPASYTLCNGVCGKEYRGYVLELSRLVITTPRINGASTLIGRTLRQLPNHVIVSYADGNEHVGHVGYVYQATNWIYTGRGNAEPVWVEESTGNVVSYTRRHIDAKARELGYDWKEGASSGPGLITKPQLGKHRYVTFTGDKRFKREALASLRYPSHPYPKGETRRHYRCVMDVCSRNGTTPPK